MVTFANLSCIWSWILPEPPAVISFNPAPLAMVLARSGTSLTSLIMKGEDWICSPSIVTET